METSKRSLAGIAMMVVGALSFLPAATPSSGGVITLALVPGVLLLTAGTYLVGTDTDGQVV